MLTRVVAGFGVVIAVSRVVNRSMMLPRGNDKKNAFCLGAMRDQLTEGGRATVYESDVHSVYRVSASFGVTKSCQTVSIGVNNQTTMDENFLPPRAQRARRNAFLCALGGGYFQHKFRKAQIMVREVHNTH